MASPQTENGYTSISNELVEAMAQHDFGFSKGLVFMSIIRLTYGCHKKEDKISISRICELTGLSKRTVIYTLQNLETQKKLTITRSIKNGLKDINSIAIQKNYEVWNDYSFAPQYLKLKEKARSSAKLRRSSAKLSELVVQNPVKEVNSFAHTKETITKDNTKEIIHKNVLGFGNPEINDISSYFLKVFQLPEEDCSKKQSRQYWNHLIRASKTGVSGVKWLIDMAHGDEFYKNNITSSKDLYYKRVKIVSRKRGDVPRVAIMPKEAI